LRLHSVDGIVGGQFASPRRQEHGLQLGDILLLYTDGIREHFDVGDYPQILRQSPRLIVRQMVSRFGKRYDDATCIAIKRIR
jgi:serine/threonine protein phosphatase PrpC